ncbi:hypothetical protein BH20VER1_BH20VER1_00560 [soil metagenome]
MNRQQLEHIIRAAAANADTRDVVIIGSQAILGTYPDAPEELLVSLEADVFPKECPERSILIDGAIGERSVFHETFGYYAHGVDETTAILPEGWRERLVRVENENTRGAIGWCLEPHDLAVSKLAAGRPKDLEFVAALLRHRLVGADSIRERLAQTDFEDACRDLCITTLKRLAS